MIAVRLWHERAILRESVFTRLPVSIGRGPDCDFVLLDPTVSLQHARIELDEEGRVLIRDVGSRNGIVVGTSRTGEAVVSPESSLRCRLGSSEVEILALSPEAATQELPVVSTPHRSWTWSRLRPVGHLGVGVAGALLWAVMDPGFWSPWKKDREVTLLWDALGTLGLLPILAFLLFALLRAARRRLTVGRALGALSCLVWLGPLITAASLSSYYLLSVAAHQGFTLILRSAALVTVVAFLASLGRPGSGGRFRLAWALATGALVTAGHVAAHLATRQSGTPMANYDVAMPVADITGPATSLDDYLDGVRASFGKAATAAERVRLRKETLEVAASTKSQGSQ